MHRPDLVMGRRCGVRRRLGRTLGWTGVLATCMLTGFAAPARAQTVPQTQRSTLSGVFRADQAEAGRDFYAGRCRSCHTPGGHVLTFKAKWAGRPLSEAFEYISLEMPKDSPGSLSPEETTLVLTYFLQLIGMPPGRDSLPTDAEALSTIRIDTVATQSRHTSGEKP